MKQHRLLGLLATLIVGLTACGGESQPKKPAAASPTGIRPARPTEVVGLGRIEPENKLIDLAAPASGIVQRVLVREGQQVRAGQVLLELDHNVEQAQLQEAQGKLATQQARIGASLAEVQRAQVTARNLRRTADRVSGLAAQGAETTQAADNARAEAEAQDQEVARLRDQSQVGQRQLAELQQAVTVARATLAKRTARAIGNGTLVRLDAVPGARLGEGTAVGEFAPAGRLTALCEIDELFATQVKPGQAVYLRNQGATDTLATGTVLTAAPYLKRKSLFAETAGEAEDRRVREVRVLLADQTAPLLLNSRVECVIKLNDKIVARSN